MILEDVQGAGQLPDGPVRMVTDAPSPNHPRPAPDAVDVGEFGIGCGDSLHCLCECREPVDAGSALLGGLPGEIAQDAGGLDDGAATLRQDRQDAAAQGGPEPGAELFGVKG